MSQKKNNSRFIKQQSKWVHDGSKLIQCKIISRTNPLLKRNADKKLSFGNFFRIKNSYKSDVVAKKKIDKTQGFDAPVSMYTIVLLCRKWVIKIADDCCCILIISKCDVIPRIFF